VVWLVLAPIRLLPDVSMPAGITSAIVTTSSYLASLYAMAPVTTAALIAIIFFVVVVEGAILIWKGAMWVVRKIPTIS